MFKYAIALVFSVSMLNAQSSADNISANVKKGDVYEIGKPETNNYKHINFPRANFIIKKGGIANYKRAQGQKVVVTAIKEKKDGTTEVKIKRADGGRFFGSHTFVSADFKEAIASGELQAE
jgi:hypothetical protein